MRVSLENYFNGFNEIKNYKINARYVTALAILKIFSYFIFIIPIVYLIGRVSKKSTLSSTDKRVQAEVQPLLQPVSPEKPSAETIAAAKKKTAELNALYNGLKTLSGPNAQKLFNGIKDFHSLYDKYRDPDPFRVDDMTKIFNSFDDIVFNTSGMQIAQKYWVTFYQVTADAKGVVPQPKDGNCWLHTSILGLQLINQTLCNDTYLTLRPKVVDWMQTHYKTDENLKRYIADAIEAHKTVERQHLREESDSLKEAIISNLIPSEELEQAKTKLKNDKKLLDGFESFSLNDYFSHMKKVGSHGTHAELYAISQMFQVNMAIWRDIPAYGNFPSRLTKEYDEQISYPDATHTINAVLTQEGNHFNYRIPTD